MIRARIFKLLRSPEIDSKESIPPAYVAWRAGSKTLFLLAVPALIDCSKIPAQISKLSNHKVENGYLEITVANSPGLDILEMVEVTCEADPGLGYFRNGKVTCEADPGPASPEPEV